MAERSFDMPWFPFWAKDFTDSRSVRMMTPEEVGAYVLLLCCQWKDGPIPTEGSLSTLTNGADQDTVQSVLEKCFTLTDEGWVNDRLELERKRQLDKHERRVSAGKKGAEVRWGKEDSSTANSNANATAMRRQWQPEPDTDTDTEKEEPSIVPLWNVWLEELGGDPPHARLTKKRQEKLEALYTECLAASEDPIGMFRQVLKAVKNSDHHMSERAYQFPESLFRNEERRDRWVSIARNGSGSAQSGVTYDRL